MKIFRRYFNPLAEMVITRMLLKMSLIHMFSNVLLVLIKFKMVTINFDDGDDGEDDVVEDDGGDCLEDEFGPYSSPMGNRSSSSGHRAWRALGPVGAWAAAGTCKARPARPRLPATGLEGTTVRRSALAAYLPLHCSFTTSAATACAIIIITVVVVAFDLCFVK